MNLITEIKIVTMVQSLFQSENVYHLTSLNAILRGLLITVTNLVYYFLFVCIHELLFLTSICFIREDCLLSRKSLKWVRGSTGDLSN